LVNGLPVNVWLPVHWLLLDYRITGVLLQQEYDVRAPPKSLNWLHPAFVFAGRSNALNIAERLGLDGRIISEARSLHGEANLEASEVSRPAIGKGIGGQTILFGDMG
jgi:hypothetical protein